MMATNGFKTDGEESKDYNFKDVETMKTFIQECVCSRIFEYESAAFPLATGNQTEYSEYEMKYVVQNYNGSLCDRWKLWDADTETSDSVIEMAFYTRVLFVISLLGLVGNITSLVVLVAIGLQSSAGRIKRVARHGLMALAVSDALICLTAVPGGFIDRFPIALSLGFSLLYAAYGEAVMSIFITSSTWITVTMAAGRYFAISSPFRARDTIRDSNAKRCVTAIAFLSLLCNVPRFWWMSIESTDCAGQHFYFRWYGPLALENASVPGKVYFWLYSGLVIFFPLILLVVSSICLVRKLRQTTSMRYDAGTGIAPSCQYISTRDIQITVTLITIATVHVILVSPAEVLSFLRIDGTDEGVAAIFNTMQVANFTLNFLLYAVLNTAFRRTLLDLVRCRVMGWRLIKRDSGVEPQCHRLLTLQSYVNVPETANNNLPPIEDVINTSL